MSPNRLAVGACLQAIFSTRRRSESRIACKQAPTKTSGFVALRVSAGTVSTPAAHAAGYNGAYFLSNQTSDRINPHP